MGTEKGIRFLALVSSLAILTGCASHKDSGGVSVTAQSGLSGSKWGYYSGVSIGEAKTMYYALYKFGHHWKFPIKRGKPVKYKGELVTRGEQIPRAIPVNPEQINEARDWISNTDPSLEQIEQRANTEAR